MPLQVVATIPAKPGSEERVSDVLTELVAATRTAGDGGLDHSALYRTIARLSGRGSDTES